MGGQIANLGDRILENDLPEHIPPEERWCSGRAREVKGVETHEHLPLEVVHPFCQARLNTIGHVNCNSARVVISCSLGVCLGPLAVNDRSVPGSVLGAE